MCRTLVFLSWLAGQCGPCHAPNDTVGQQAVAPLKSDESGAGGGAKDGIAIDPQQSLQMHDNIATHALPQCLLGCDELRSWLGPHASEDAAQLLTQLIADCDQVAQIVPAPWVVVEVPLVAYVKPFVKLPGSIIQAGSTKPRMSEHSSS